MNRLRARTLLAQSFARRDRADLVLQVTVGAREPVKVTATGLGADVALLVWPRWPLWHMLGWRAHRTHRRATRAAKGRARSVRLRGLANVYAVWAVIAWALCIAMSR